MNDRRQRIKGWLMILAIGILLAGVGIFSYPTVSDQINRYRQDGVISDYVGTVEALNAENSGQMLEEAEAYNRWMLSKEDQFEVPEEELNIYNSILNITGTGMMGYVDVPKVHIHLPVYHGSDEEVLQGALGHLEGTSLPVGGRSTHAVISGHRGLPSARLFTDIDQLVVGDHFLIRVLDRVLTYEVDQILTVLPEEMNGLKIVPDEDYCTLITCTPYGVNTHRLLVRGKRIPNDELEVAAANTLKVSTALILPLLMAPILLIILVGLIIRVSRQKKHRKGDENA